MCRGSRWKRFPPSQRDPLHNGGAAVPTGSRPSDAPNYPEPAGPLERHYRRSPIGTAGGLLLAGVVDGDQLLEAVRAGYERGKGSLEGYDPSR